MYIKKDMICYMCDALATTTEHAPPACFFPEGFRKNLFTVPSCAKHNHDNSTDVEYARNVICGQRGTENKAGTRIFETAKRCFDKRPKLFFQTFAEVRNVTVDGEETAAFPLDLPRLRAVMRAIAHALYFRDMGVRQDGSFGVFFSSLESRASLYGGSPDRAAELRRILGSANSELRCDACTRTRGFQVRSVPFRRRWPLLQV